MQPRAVERIEGIDAKFHQIDSSFLALSKFDRTQAFNQQIDLSRRDLCRIVDDLGCRRLHPNENAEHEQTQSQSGSKFASQTKESIDHDYRLP